MILKETPKKTVTGSGNNKNEQSAREYVQYHGRILLVEDSRVNQVVASKMLISLGLEVDIATDGREAIDQAEVNQYDLIFMDCLLPHVDGYEATRIIRQRESINAATAIIALTANTEIDDRKRCKEAGMDAVVKKPFRKIDLINCLQVYLGKSA